MSEEMDKKWQEKYRVALRVYDESDPGTFSDREALLAECVRRYAVLCEKPAQVAAVLGVNPRDVQRLHTAGWNMLRQLSKPRRHGDVESAGIQPHKAAVLAEAGIRTVAEAREWLTDPHRKAIFGIGPQIERALAEAAGVQIAPVGKAQASATDQMPRCGTCKHAVARPLRDHPDDLVCSAVGGSRQWTAEFQAELHGLLCFDPVNDEIAALEGSENTFLRVSPTFGCVLHEART